jgi:hypothetical protein
MSSLGIAVAFDPDYQILVLFFSLRDPRFIKSMGKILMV